MIGVLGAVVIGVVGVGCAAAPEAVPAGDGAAAMASARGRDEGARHPRDTTPPKNPPPRPDDGCPKTHAEAKALRTDCSAPPFMCVYPEGMCGCESAQQCGGAERPPLPPMWGCDRPPREPCPPYP